MSSRIKKLIASRQALTTKKGTIKRRISVRKRDVTAVEKISSIRGRKTFAEQAALGQPQTPQGFTLRSTAIRAVAYDKNRQILQIEFVKGGTYLYFNVPELIFEGLTSPFTQSKGRYFWNNIRGQYSFRRVR